MLVAVGLLLSSLTVRAHAEDPLDLVLNDPVRTYPNLVPNVSEVLIENTRTVNGGFGVEPGLFLKFDTRAQNLGTVSLQLTVDDVEAPETSTISQCVSWTVAEARLCRETATVNGFTWHELHRHFHFEGYAGYQFRRLAPTGRPDYSDAGLIRAAEQVSSCLMDAQQVSPDGYPAPLYPTCLPTGQGITAGWTDVFKYDYEGQNVPIHDVADGTYALIVNMDHGNSIQETSDDDNYVEVTVRISENRSKAEIVDRRWPGPDDRGTPTTTTSTTKKKPKHDKDK